MRYDWDAHHRESWMLRLSALLLALTLPATAMAQDRQYRQLKLTDGRVLKAEVLETVATGLEMRTNQGDTLISFEILMDMVPIDAAEFRDDDPVLVWLHAPGYTEKMEAIYGEIPMLEIASAENLPPGVVIALTECGADFDCMSQQVEDPDWLWLVTVAPPTDDTEARLVVRGRTTGGTQIERVNTPTDSAADLWHAGNRVIGLIHEGDIKKDVLTALGETQTTTVPDPVAHPDAGLGWTRNRVRKSAFTPLPGYSALAQKDTGGFALGLGIGVAGTGLIAAVMAANKVPLRDSIPITAAGFYVINVTTNQAVGMTAYKKAKANSVSWSIAPNGRGGATVGISGRL